MIITDGSRLHKLDSFIYGKKVGKKRRESNSQLHDEVQVGCALKDVLQGDDVGVLDSEDRSKPSHTLQTSSAILPPDGAVAAQYRAQPALPPYQ